MKEQIGRYKLIKLMGEGATAHVYLAQDTVLERQVVLKLLKPILMADSTAFARFRQEAKWMARLSHPHIVMVHDMGEADGQFYIVMHYVPGEALEEILQHGHLTAEETQKLVSQVGGALDYAHEQNFLHRDVKPANILRDLNDDFWLMDFGLAKALMETGVNTNTGAIMGTPAYIPPEIWLGQSACPQSDQYSLACVVYEALTGDVLFSGPTPPAVMTKHVMEQIDLDQTKLNENHLVVLKKALSKQPEERFMSLAEFQVALENKVVEHDVVISHPPEDRTKFTQEEMEIELPGGLKMVFVRVPAGEFLMGASKANRDEKPHHVVYLDEYWIGKYPVTNAQFKVFDPDCFGRVDQADHPVVKVSWNDAQKFCVWISRVSGQKICLPTEAEWEKAARGTEGRIYPWGNEAPSMRLANYDEGVGWTTPVNQYPGGVSPYGAFDMAGNVWEWCADWYKKDYYKTSPYKNPTEPGSGEKRVVRGGSWRGYKNFMRASRRDSHRPEHRNYTGGFRCVLSL